MTPEDAFEVLAEAGEQKLLLKIPENIAISVGDIEKAVSYFEELVEKAVKEELPKVYDLWEDTVLSGKTREERAGCEEEAKEVLLGPLEDAIRWLGFTQLVMHFGYDKKIPENLWNRASKAWAGYILALYSHRDDYWLIRKERVIRNWQKALGDMASLVWFLDGGTFRKIEKDARYQANHPCLPWRPEGKP